MAKQDSDKWIRPEEMIDTTNLQRKSLSAFAEGLGYIRYGKYYVSHDYDNKARMVISFQTMCKLHNNHYEVLGHRDYFEKPFNFSTYKIRKARAGKLVHCVSLQMDKRTGYIKASSNIVSFTFIEYEGFLDLKYL